MELVNDFSVNVPVGEAWTTLTDVERIAPCLPGALLHMGGDCRAPAWGSAAQRGGEEPRKRSLPTPACCSAISARI